jgi:hypothetical protein
MLRDLIAGGVSLTALATAASAARLRPLPRMWTGGIHALDRPPTDIYGRQP